MNSRTTRLIEAANQAIAWGRPSSESTGYTATEFINLILNLRNRLLELRHLEEEEEPIYELGIPEPKVRIKRL